MAERKIQNPVPFISEAAEAANSYLNARRAHLVLSAQLRAKSEAKRAAYGSIAVYLAAVGAWGFFFWLSAQLLRAGLPPWAVALIWLGFFAAASGVFGYLAAGSSFLRRRRSKEKT